MNPKPRTTETRATPSVDAPAATATAPVRVTAKPQLERLTAEQQKHRDAVQKDLQKQTAEAEKHIKDGTYHDAGMQPRYEWDADGTPVKTARGHLAPRDTTPE